MELFLQGFVSICMMNTQNFKEGIDYQRNVQFPEMILEKIQEILDTDESFDDYYQMYTLLLDRIRQ